MGIVDRIKEEASSAMSATFDTTPQPQQRQQYQQQSQQQPVYQQPMMQTRIPRYVVLQVTLKEKMIGTGSGNLSELERVINNQCAHGFKLHTISTASGGSSSLIGGDRIQATLVFEQIV